MNGLLAWALRALAALVVAVAIYGLRLSAQATAWGRVAAHAKAAGTGEVVMGPVSPEERGDTLALPSFRYEDHLGRVLTERDIAAMPRSYEWKLAEAARYHDLWDGYRPGLSVIEDDSPRGFHWGEKGD
ncbi:MAG TPA: hypothetical protein VIZ43_08550 [Trebonia sp.]